MFHTFALIHDDVMDHSATRRGRPTVHRAFTDRHSDHSHAAQLGASAAVLLGDLAFTWSDELLHTAGLTPVQLCAALPVMDAMRSEAMYGQYLDLLATGHPTPDVDAALRKARYKTAKYTIERPLHLGAALAGARAGIRQALTAYALPLGEAFQLRDDLLGVYGNPDRTGKPNLDDLREGKHTVLIALALQYAEPYEQRIMRALVGDPDLDEDSADRVRELLTSTGARDRVEHMIQTRHAQAQQALDYAPFPPAVTTALRDLSHAALTRTT
ncbi:polyprenyl synthetase family protein [Streptomyces luteireticuli]|uniref:polyprenyl synthetase family protein n=1 Tax=Streptomyces luteireticuli TaxID=173858 RepID=UPI0035576316